MLGNSHRGSPPLRLLRQCVVGMASTQPLLRTSSGMVELSEGLSRAAPQLPCREGFHQHAFQIRGALPVFAILPALVLRARDVVQLERKQVVRDPVSASAVRRSRAFRQGQRAVTRPEGWPSGQNRIEFSGGV